ncbi:MAG: flagellar M-ring protein FliF, partial [Thermotogaceae bacterium]|nr:flagellar M-ring protein FliF [Thermotogaceae bacterium]
LGILSFFIIYLMSLQIRRAKARKLALERRRKLEEELRKALEEEEKELTPEEKELAELREELERIYGRSPEEVAEVVKLWFYERGT